LADHPIDTVIFDLDGVVTDTAKVHAAAWKELFDAYLRLRERRDGEPFVPFDIIGDYLTYVDGKPRHEGVQSFLGSRKIRIPAGDPSDGPDRETVRGLGNQKNRLFREILERDGVEVFPGTLKFIDELKARGDKLAIVTSSKNCQAVLRQAGLENVFDTMVDGILSESLGLKGKPHPDTFLKSAELLGADPGRAAVIEDSIAGVEAGKRGHFALVIGIARKGGESDLRRKGADLVVGDLGEISYHDIESWLRLHGRELPSALDRLGDIRKGLSRKRAAVFLDYDGTLTPIVEIPDNAVMSAPMREAVRELAASTPVAIISGRDRAKVRGFVQLDNIVYAGSHGFDIAGPDHTLIQHKEGNRFLPALENAQKEISERVKGIKGSLVERTGFSISVHYRMVAEDQVPLVDRMVEETLENNPELERTHGKKVFEIRPRIDWHKGKAVMWILKALGLDRPDVVPFYLGDDTTDEDAFRALAGRGIGILVADSPRQTTATYRLTDPEQVQRFLSELTQIIRDRSQ